MKKFVPFLFIVCLIFSACASTGSGTSKVRDNPKNGESEQAAEETAENDQGMVEPEPFSLYPAYLHLPLGQHVTLDVSAVPDGKKLNWSSADPSIATVDENGRITPIAEGGTIITAALADDASITASCGVLVTTDGNILLWDE